MAVEFHLGERLTLRKPHPCGGVEWRVERLGADVGIRCLTCGHYLLTPRRKLERATKSHQPPLSVEGASSSPPFPTAGPSP